MTQNEITSQKKNKYLITAIVVCFNKSRHLEGCLKSLSLCSEIIVFDMGSTDGSLEIANKLASRVVFIPRVDLVEKIYKEIVIEATNDWVILHDPDEEFPEELFPYIINIIESDPNLALFSIPWFFFFLGQQLKSTIWGGQKLKSKLFHRKRVQLSSLVHNGVSVLPGYVRYKVPFEMGLSIKHYWVDNITQMFSKHWRYVLNEGEAKFNKGKRFNIIHMVVASIRGLHENLFQYNGFRDGWRGIFLSFFYAWYIMMGHLSLFWYQNFIFPRLQDRNESNS